MQEHYGSSTSEEYSSDHYTLDAEDIANSDEDADAYADAYAYAYADSARGRRHLVPRAQQVDRTGSTEHQPTSGWGSDNFPGWGNRAGSPSAWGSTGNLHHSTGRHPWHGAPATRTAQPQPPRDGSVRWNGMG